MVDLLTILSSRAFELVEVLEVDLSLGDESFQLRVEFFKRRSSPTEYRVRLWRSEFYRIQPSFPRRADGSFKHDPSDEVILKEWESFPADRIDLSTADSIDDAERIVLSELARWLGEVQGAVD